MAAEAGQLLRQPVEGEAQRRLDHDLCAGDDDGDGGPVPRPPQYLRHGQDQGLLLQIVRGLEDCVAGKIYQTLEISLPTFVQLLTLVRVSP